MLTDPPLPWTDHRGITPVQPSTQESATVGEILRLPAAAAERRESGKVVQRLGTVLPCRDMSGSVARQSRTVEGEPEFAFDEDIAARYGISTATLRRDLLERKPQPPRERRKVGRVLKGGWLLSPEDEEFLAARHPQAPPREALNQGEASMAAGQKVSQDGLTEGWSIAMDAYIREAKKSARLEGELMRLEAHNADLREFAYARKATG